MERNARRERFFDFDGKITKKGPSSNRIFGEDRQMNASQLEKADQDLVAPLDVTAGFVRPTRFVHKRKIFQFRFRYREYVDINRVFGHAQSLRKHGSHTAKVTT